MCIRDRLKAISNYVPGYSYAFTWIRKDWLDKLGLKEPGSLEELQAVAKAFVEEDPDRNGQNDTIGLLCDQRVGGIYNSNHTMDPIFGYYGSYPRQWLKDESGNVTYGTIAPETKEALATLRQMYSDKLIDEEFAVRNPNDINSPLAAGKCGIIFGPWWAPSVSYTHLLNKSDIRRKMLERAENNQWIYWEKEVYYVRRYSADWIRADEEPFLFIKMERDYLYKIKNMARCV